MSITNRQRMDYLLDWLVEPFPEEAQLKSCACGDAGPNASRLPNDRFPSKRELIEESLLEGLKLQVPEMQDEMSLTQALDKMTEAQIGSLLTSMPLSMVDLHLNDLALFMDPNRPTTVEEIEEWDRRHANDFNFI